MKDPNPTEPSDTEPSDNVSKRDGSHHDRPHDKDAGSAADVDHVWFEKNRGRQHRLRNLIPFESKDPLGLPPLGMTWRILVTRTVGGGRLRLPVPLPVDVANETVDDDRQLGAMFDRIAPPDAVTICKTPTGKSAASKKSETILRGPKDDGES